jgi:hypothetical protein
VQNGTKISSLTEQHTAPGRDARAGTALFVGELLTLLGA